MNLTSFDPSSLISLLFSQVSEELPLTKEQFRTNIATIIEPKIINGKINLGLFISNYGHISKRAITDLSEIDGRLSEIKSLDDTIPSSEDYTHRKLRYFAEINRNARIEILAFLCKGLLEFLSQHESIDFVSRQNEELLNFMIKGCYQYGNFKRYFDFRHDFSTEAKIRFVPGIELVELQKRIEQYIELKAQGISNYQAELNRMVNENNVLDYLYDRINVHNIMNKRLEVFEILKFLYSEKKWQSFISLALLQIEGLFYDCCKILKVGTLSNTAGSLVEKVDKTFKDSPILMLSIYPYYAFDIPVLRNEIAHTGLIDRHDLNHIANELIIDMNTIISWVYRLSHEKYTIMLMISDNIEKAKPIDIKNEAELLLVEMMGCMDIAGFDYLDFIKNPLQFSDEIRYMKTPNGFWEGKAQKMMSIINTEAFWLKIEELIGKNTSRFNVLASKLKNTFIPILQKDSSAKKACMQVDRKLKQCSR